jgi:predicted DCC family thiol-disulfide oxidoreductase YuxK
MGTDTYALRLPRSVRANPNRAQVLYDGQCPLCLKSIALLRRLDWLHVLNYVNVRDPDQLAACDVIVPQGRLLEEMHLITPGGRQLLHGFNAFRWMAWRLPALWLLAPFLYIPGVPTLGQRVYLWVARNRFRLVPCHGGVCTLPRHHSQASNNTNP